MQTMPIEAQEELQQRLMNRGAVRDDGKRLCERVLAWVINAPLTKKERDEFFEEFQASGHYGEYLKWPEEDAQARLKKLQKTLPELKQRIRETPLDYMSAVELSYVHDRIELAISIFEEQPPGTREEAIRLYKTVGDIIRRKVREETGHWPEEFPLPEYGGRITGKENLELFEIQPHQPALLIEEPK
jgi:hypothetical protein